MSRFGAALLALVSQCSSPEPAPTRAYQGQPRERAGSPVAGRSSCRSALCALDQCGPDGRIWPDCLAGCGMTPAGREAAVYCLLDSPLCTQLLAACEPIAGERCQPGDFSCAGSDVVGCDPVSGGDWLADCPARCREMGLGGGDCIEASAEGLGLQYHAGAVFTCRCQ